MKSLKNSSGFGAVEVLLIAVIVIILGCVGYRVYQLRTNTNKLNAQSAAEQIAIPKTTSSATAVPAAINSTTDLNQAAQALNSDNPNDNSADLTQLDSQASAF